MKKARSKIALLLAAAMVVTGIQVPVYGATDENVTVTEVAEEAVVETAEATEEVTEDTPVGADSTIYVRSAAELVTALNGKDLSGQPLPTKEKIRIQMVAPLAGSDYKLTKELLGGKNLTIKEGADITLDMNGNVIDVSENAAEYAIEVPKSTSFSIENSTPRGGEDTPTSVIKMGIVNDGILNVVDVSVESQYHDVIVNHDGATASLESAYLMATSQNAVAVRNAGTMTIGARSTVVSKTNSCVAIENTGDVVLNCARVGVEIDGNFISECAIINRTKDASLSIRGTGIKSDGYGVYNDEGTVTIGEYASDLGGDVIAYIQAEKGAVLTVNGGTVIGYEKMKLYGGVVTTPFAGNDVYTGTTDGAFKMLDGEVEKITYSADSLPILVGGTVGNKATTSEQALNLMVGKNEVESDLSKYTYLTEEAGTPVAGTYTADGGVTKVAYAIVDGKVYQKETQTDGDNSILVTNETQLRNAVISGGNIALKTSITLTQSLEITKDVRIRLSGMYQLIQGNENVAITVAEGVDAEFTFGTLSFAKMKTDASAITNFGNLTMEDVDVSISAETEEVTGAKAIMNHGDLKVNGVYDEEYGYAAKPKITVAVKNGIGIDNAETGIVELSGSAQVLGTNKNGVTAIRNAGTCTMQDVAYVCGTTDGVSQCTAVYSTGKFIMNGGEVWASLVNRGLGNYAIVYTGEHYPILQDGTVYGARYENLSAVSADDPTYGSAVVKAEGDGVYSRGYYQSSDSEPVWIIDGQNSYVIEEGVVPIDLINFASEKYLLLQSGDVVTRIEGAFSAAHALNIATVFTRSITSSNPTIASVTQGGTTEAPTWTLSANKAGYTTLKATYTLNDKTPVEDYLRIEVTDDKAALTAEDYEGSLLENQVAVNAYANDKITYEVPFEFHLDTSDMETATGASYSEVQAASFKVSEIIIDDKEFNQYFDYAIKNTGLPVLLGDEKKDSFLFWNKTSNNGASTKLLDDEVKSINQVEVKAKITNGVSGKDMVISLGYLDINVQAVKPVVKANGGYTLNSAYRADATYYDGKIKDFVYPNRQSTTSLKDYVTAMVNGEELVDLSSYFEEGEEEGYESPFTVSIKTLSDGISAIDENIAITANVKKGKRTITTEVKLKDYVGAYQVKIPVKIINKYPKASLDKKKITVASKSSAETDIPLYLYAKDAESAGMVADVEIVTAKGKTSNYIVVNKNFGATRYDEVSKTYNTYEFYLQPKSTVNKAETITLKVTYKDTKAKAGKAYSTTVKVKVKPANKFTMKQNGKTSMSTAVGAGTDVYIKTTPEYFDGVKLVVTALNGKTEVPEEVAGAVIESKGNGTHALKVIATEATKSRGKKLEFGVTWVDETGKTPTSAKTAKIKVSLFDDTAKITSTTPSITVQPEKIYKKVVYYPGTSLGLKEFDASNTTYVEYKAPVKFKGTGADAWDMTDYSDNMFDITYKAKKIILTASNKVIGGTQYTIPLEFTHGRTGETQTVNLTVKVKDVKKVSAKLNTDTVTLYQEAPYAMQMLITSLGNTCMTNPVGGAGLTEITNVEIVDAENSPFEIYEYNLRMYSLDLMSVFNTKDIRTYGITFKDKKYPTNASAKSLKSVTLKITYGNGIDDNYKTATVKLKVNVK